MNISLLAVGSLKTSWVKEGCKYYSNRLHVDIVEIRASKQKDQKKQSQEESQTVLDRLEKVDGQVWVLDETGKHYTSSQFATELSMAKDQGTPVTIVLGGAYGLTSAVKDRADRIVCLSSMTFPHELCRIVILEQIYRADQMIKGSGYHH